MIKSLLILFIISLSLWGCVSSQNKKYPRIKRTHSSTKIDSFKAHLINEDSVVMAILKSDKMKVVGDIWGSGIVLANIFVDNDARYIRHDIIRSPSKIVTEMIESFIPYMRFEIEKGKKFGHPS